MTEKKPTSFEEANQEKQTGVIGEFMQFLRHNKKFWLLPLLLLLLGLGLIIILGGTAAAPFIYTLF